MANELPRVFDLDRRRVRERAVARFGVGAHGRRIRRASTRGSWRRTVPDSAVAGPRRLRRGLAGRTVLGIFAHPDDESLACGGTLARLADAGARVVLLCASRGEAGSISDPSLVPDGDLGGVRARELRDAAAVLGIAEVIVLRPSGRRSALGRRAGAARTKSSTLIQRYRPDAVITFAEDGLYWHLDHIGVHERTYHRGAVARRRRAAALLRDDAARRDARGRRTPRTPRAARRPDSSFWGIAPDAFGDGAKPPSFVVDVRDWVPRKLAALRCHRTQMGPNNPMAWIDEERGAPLARRRAVPPRAARRGRRSDCSSISATSNMRIETLDVLRCPYCGGRLELVDSLFHRRTADEIHDGILGCHCCIFPVVDGIPVLHLLPAATAARDHIAGRHGPSSRGATMFGLDDDAQRRSVRRRRLVRHRDLSRHRRGARAEFRGRLLPLSLLRSDLHRRRRRSSRAVGGDGARRRGARAIDICGGSGHVTRTLLDLSSAPPVLADLYFAKVWLARRFTAPGCEPVCCDGNAPMPFARGAFSFAMCTDAFMYIWTKRQFVGEMERLVDRRRPATTPGAVLIGHTHNERTWSPSHGQPLSPEGYAALFETHRAARLRRAGPVRRRRRRRAARSVAARRRGDARSRTRR